MPSKRRFGPSSGRADAARLAELSRLVDDHRARFGEVPPDLRRDVLRAVGVLWEPRPGPQTNALDSPADILGYGGQAGGGKSDLILGAALLRHRESIIFRREYAQLKALVKRSRVIIGKAGRYNSTDKIWTGLPGGRTLEFGGVQHEDSVEAFQGSPHDLICFDEACHFLEPQFWFLTGWNRSAHPGQRCRIILTFNPPTTIEGQWVVRLFAPWLDKKYPDPAEPGEIRWMTRVDGKAEFSREYRESTDDAGNVIRPRSITFYPARLKDNPYLSGTNYAATLAGLPEPLRSQLLYGDFDIGMLDHAWQVIPTRWIEASMAAHGDYESPPAPMDAIGADIASGGRDRTVFAPKHDRWFAPLVCYPGSQTPDGRAAAAMLMKVWRPNVPVNVDAIGWGSDAYGRIRDYGVPANPVNVALPSKYKDRSGRFVMRNLRAEMYWRLRDGLDPDSGGPPLLLPDDPELLQELAEARYEVGPSGILIEDKDEIKLRIGRSPDKADAVALAMLPAGSPRLVVGGQRGTLANQLHAH